MYKKYLNLTGGEILYRKLIENKVKHVFMYIGGCNMGLIDPFYKSKDIKFISTINEAGAGHMAQGYARALQKHGIVFGTSGPGSTNLVTSIQDAMLDSTPVIYVTGQVKSNLLGTDAFQECNIIDITKSCTKWNHQVKHIKDLIPTINKALDITINGRPGPVLIDICKDVSMNKLTQKDINNIPSYFNINKDKLNNNLLIKDAANLINNATKPILYVGQGGLSASKEITKLAKLANIPVTTTYLGLGAFNENNKLSLEMLGMHGSYGANNAMQQSDLVIAVGARWDDRVTANLDKFIPVAKESSKSGTGGVIHIDISNKELNKLVKADVAINGFSKDILQQLLPYIKKNKNKDWLNQISKWKKIYPFSYTKNKNGKLKGQQIIEEIYTQTKNNKNIIITADVGQNCMWSSQFYKYTTPYSFIASGSLGTMGTSMPFGIGAKIAKPNHTIISITGEGGFNMSMQELMTAVKNKINIKVIILNNSCLGMVRQWQDIYHNGRYTTTTDLAKIDYVNFAKSVGCKGLTCKSEKNLKSTIEEILNYNEGPIICNFDIEYDKVLPFVESHKSLDDMILK